MIANNDSNNPMASDSPRRSTLPERADMSPAQVAYRNHEPRAWLLRPGETENEDTREYDAIKLRHEIKDNSVTRSPGTPEVTANGTVYDDKTLIQVQAGEIKKLNKIISDYQQFGEIQPDPFERCPECLSAGPHHKYCSRGNKS